MVDGTLPIKVEDDRPLRFMFLDLNAFFASVEQQEDPTLRGRPVVVAPMITDSTCAIAASYEAKKWGVKTLTNIGEARRKCPELVVVEAKPSLYVAYHKKVLEAVDHVLPIDKVCSIDEMRFRLLGVEKEPTQAQQIARAMKDVIAEGVGSVMKCSIGIAPNAFLAKIGTELQKPDGLVVLTRDELQARVETLGLTDLTGINKRMKARLNAAGIFSVAEMYAASPRDLRSAFGSIIGERWWYLIRGYELEEEEVQRKSLGHSHVLPPNLRTDQGCADVLRRLITKAAARMRAENLVARSMNVYVAGFDKSWGDHTRLTATNDTLAFNDAFRAMWEKRDFQRPRTVGVTFSDLAEAGGVTPSLFDHEPERDHLNQAVDAVNKKFGKNSIYLASIDHVKDTATEKIAYQKTDLFSEGKDDNVWPDTFRGIMPE